MKKFSLNFFGLDVHFQSQNKLFAQLFETKFGAFHSGSTEKLATGSVHILFGQKTRFETYNWKKLDTHIRIDTEKNAIEKTHYYLGKKCICQLVFDAQKKTHSVTITEKPSLVFEMLNLISRGQLRRQLYQTIIKLFIEQPLYHLICKEAHVFCLHAAGVSKENHGVLFYGLNGVGKSTLAQYAVSQQGYSYMSDNYTLISNTKMYASPETVRLAQDSVEKLAAHTTSQFGFGKQNICCQPGNTTVAKITKIIFVTRGDTFSMDALTQEQFEHLLVLQHINGEDVQTSNLANLTYFSSAVAFPAPSANYYSVTIRSYDDLETLANALLN